jgi:hypothetical protein
MADEVRKKKSKGAAGPAGSTASSSGTPLTPVDRLRMMSPAAQRLGRGLVRGWNSGDCWLAYLELCVDRSLSLSLFLSFFLSFFLCAHAARDVAFTLLKARQALTLSQVGGNSSLRASYSTPSHGGSFATPLPPSRPARTPVGPARSTPGPAGSGVAKAAAQSSGASTAGAAAATASITDNLL